MPERIDYRFLGKLEGGSRTIGYVPAPGASKSGVTIATGFDLGQRNEDDLRALKLDQALITQLRPYLGMTGANAQALLVKTPLLITVNQAQAIDSAIKSEHVERLRLKYDTAPGNRKRFIGIPPEAQTVIASVSFQYGVGLDLRAPKFWKAVTAQDWPEAVKILRSFGDAYPSRRMTEAALLERIR